MGGGGSRGAELSHNFEVGGLNNINVEIHVGG